MPVVKHSQPVRQFHGRERTLHLVDRDPVSPKRQTIQTKCPLAVSPIHGNMHEERPVIGGCRIITALENGPLNGLVVRVAPRVVFRREVFGAIVARPFELQIGVLNPVGATIMAMCRGGAPVSRVLRLLCGAFPDEPGVVDDVGEFVREMIGAGWLQVENQAHTIMKDGGVPNGRASSA